MPTILVVDDEEIIRRLFNDTLTSNGFNVLFAENGVEGEKMFLANKVDLVISDIMMPEMDGIEFVKKLRFYNPKTKICLMTGYHKHQNIPFCINENVYRYIQKPFKMFDVLKIIDEVLSENLDKTVNSFEHNIDGWIEADLIGTEESLTRIYGYIEQYIKTFVPQKTAYKAMHAFFEMIRNSLEWGNKFDSSKTIKISCMVLSDKVLFKIEDQGNGFNVNAGFKPEKDPFLRQDLRLDAGKRPGGYGIEITSKMMDEFFYNEVGNCLIMSKYFEKEN